MKRADTALWPTWLGCGSHRRLLVMTIREALLSSVSGTPAAVASLL